MTNQPLVLPGHAFVVLWEKLGLGPLPTALFLPSPGATVPERARIEHAAALELSRLGLGAGRDADHHVVATLRLLAQPELDYHGWIVPASGRSIGVLAASAGRRAVLSTLDGQVVGLTPVADPAMAVAQWLPPLPPAPAPVIIPEHSRAAFEYAVGEPVLGNGQLFVAVRDRVGRRRAHPGAIEYVDTARGRWLLRRERAGTTAVPGPPEAIAAELDRVHRQLRVPMR